jgi:glycolate oxidase FAD binding subunit
VSAAVSARSVASGLAAIVSGGRVREDSAALQGSAVDGVVPRWIVQPASVEEMSRVLGFADDAALAVAPRGSGSALGLGSPPERLDILLDTSGLAAVVDYSPDDLTVTVGAGVTAGALAAVLAAHRQWLPIDPPGGATRTLGGITATNASGPLRARYGTMRDLLLGVRFVQADGVVTWGGARVVKSVSGYDVPKLMVGSLGTLGVLAELTLRLHPVPEREATWLATFPTAEQARACVARVLDGTLQPSRVEFLNRAALAACDLEPAPAALAISIGTVAAGVTAQGESLATLVRRDGGRERPAPERFWSAYERALSAREIVLRVRALPSELTPALAAIERAAIDAAGVAPAIAGSAAAGVLRVGLPAMEGARLATLVTGLRDALGAAGGGIVIERASPAVRAAVDPWGPVDPDRLELMRRLKDEFDPTRILNPGRFVGGI